MKITRNPDDRIVFEQKENSTLRAQVNLQYKVCDLFLIFQPPNLPFLVNQAGTCKVVAFLVETRERGARWAFVDFTTLPDLFRLLPNLIRSVITPSPNA